MSAIAQMLITSKNCDLTYNLVHHISHVCWHQVHLHMSKSTSRLLKYFNPSNPRRLFCSSSEMLLGRHILASNETEDLYKQAMAKVPQQVIVVTTGMYQDEPRTWIKRGVTCSTFSSVSLHPPIISFCLNQGRRMHNLIKTTGMFAVHILAQDQVSHGIHFSKPATDNVCQFDSVPHIQGKEGLPIILGSLAVLLCDSHSHHNVGDHTVWYGNVTGVSVSETLQEPLIYFTRQFRSIGDEIFLKAFEDATLPFENWTHEAHLRMAWNYIKELGKDEATPYIKLFIQKYNEKHRDKLKSHYHETITMFFIHLVSDAIFKRTNANETFEDFMSCNQHLMDKNLILEYYNKETLFQEQARNRFIYPDKKIFLEQVKSIFIDNKNNSARQR